MLTNPLVRVAIDPGLECVPLGGPVRAHRPGVETRLGSRRLVRPSGQRASLGWGYPHRARSAGRGVVARPPPHTRTMRLELTKRGDYAVRAMLALARGSDNGLLLGPANRRRDGHPRFASCPRCSATSSEPPSSQSAPGRAGGYRLATPAGVDQPARRDRGRRGREPPPDLRAARGPVRRGRALRRPRCVLPRPGGAAERAWPTRAWSRSPLASQLSDGPRSGPSRRTGRMARCKSTLS